MKKLCSGFLSFVLCLNTMGVLRIHAEGEGTPEPIPDEVFETVTEETAEPESLETVEEGGPLSYIGIADEDVPKFIIIVVLIILLLLLLCAFIRVSRRNRARRRRRAERRAAEAAAEAERKESDWRNGRPGQY